MGFGLGLITFEFAFNVCFDGVGFAGFGSGFLFVVLMGLIGVV